MPENLLVITRPKTGAVGAGVAIGLARKWQVDPTLVRLTLVVLAAVSGIGLAAYAIGWLLLPREGNRSRRCSVWCRSPAGGIRACCWP